MSSLFDYQLRNPTDLTESLKVFENNLCKHLQASGDQKLSNPREEAANFTRDLLQSSVGMFGNDISVYEAYILSSGVKLEQVSKNTMIGQLGSLAVYNQQLRDILNSLGLPGHLEKQVPYGSQIIWEIWDHFETAMKFEKFAHGSNMQDKHMCVFALFTGVFTVDKRACEYFNQLTRKNKALSSVLGSVVKVSHYSNLEALD